MDTGSAPAKKCVSLWFISKTVFLSEALDLPRMVGQGEQGAVKGPALWISARQLIIIVSWEAQAGKYNQPPKKQLQYSSVLWKKKMFLH